MANKISARRSKKTGCHLESGFASWNATPIFAALPLKSDSWPYYFQRLIFSTTFAPIPCPAFAQTEKCWILISTKYHLELKMTETLTYSTAHCNRTQSLAYNVLCEFPGNLSELFFQAKPASILECCFDTCSLRSAPPRRNEVLRD